MCRIFYLQLDTDLQQNNINQVIKHVGSVSHFSIKSVSLQVCTKFVLVWLYTHLIHFMQYTTCLLRYGECAISMYV